MTADIRFYNTLTHSTEAFVALEPPRVTLYSCGPTVYDFAHIGNFRTFVFADLLRRFLQASGYQVDQVMNITDVGHMTEDDLADGGGEDKMEASARRLREAKKAGTPAADAINDPSDPYQIARYYAEAFVEDAQALGLAVADEYPQRMPFASDHVEGMKELVTRLIERDHAYVGADGVVYYSVESFPEYGRLSGNTLENLRTGSGGRVTECDLANKRHPADFLLWKPDEAHIMKWESPWGTGYPGWHLECSSMAMALLGRDTIDIHTGGEDNIFPHHECEIAQSCGATGASHFARYWMHARYLQVEGEKMSKSKGNFFTARDVFSGKVTGRPVHPSVLRFELIRAHYRAHTNFTTKGLMDGATTVRRWVEFGQRLEQEAGGQAAPVDPSHPVWEGFMQALSDDLNISGALGVVLPWVSNCRDSAATALGVFRRIDEVLNIARLPDQAADAEDGSAGEALDAAAACRELDAARAAKDYAAADALRQQLIDGGYEVRTTPDGTTAKKLLA
jgi:cysteinyl-tRNA synthetase